MARFEGNGMTRTADIAIIGGGIAGLGVAARLVPEASVIVIEREEAFATHSTGRSAAIFVRNYGNPTLRALTAASEPWFEAEIERAGAPLLSPRGELAVVDEAGVDALDSFVAEGDGLEKITPKEAVKLVPILRHDCIAGAALEANARDMDVDLIVQTYLRVLSRHDDQRLTGAQVVGLSSVSGGWRVETTKGAVACKIVVNAAGAWADEIAELADVPTIGLQPMRRSAAILPAPAAMEIGTWPMVGALDESWYFKPMGGKLMVSPSDEDPIDPQDAWPDDLVLAEGLDRFAKATTYEVTRVERSWAGLRSFVGDRSPVAGYAPHADGFFWLAGQGGYGIQTSPALSQLSADLILGRTASIAAETVPALSPARSGIGPRVDFR